MRRIGTKENPSDETSRNKKFDEQKLLAALEKGKFDANQRSGGSAAKLFVSPCAFVSSDKTTGIKMKKGS